MSTSGCIFLHEVHCTVSSGLRMYMVSYLLYNVAASWRKQAEHTYIAHSTQVQVPKLAISALGHYLLEATEELRKLIDWI